jgi:hypothetical protein
VTLTALASPIATYSLVSSIIKESKSKKHADCTGLLTTKVGLINLSQQWMMTKREKTYLTLMERRTLRAEMETKSTPNLRDLTSKT